MVLPVRTKRGEVAVLEVHFTKAEFSAVPEAQRKRYFVLAQLANELAMLRVLIIQALNGVRGPRVVVESGLGLAFMLSRLLAGRAHEAWHEHLRKSSFAAEVREMASENGLNFGAEVLPDFEEALTVCKTYFGDPENLATKVRKKLAFHNDQAALAKAFDLLPEDFSLVDFHTGKRGTTFYGTADSLAAVAVSGLIDSEDLAYGQRELANSVSKIAGDLETLIDAYIVAFTVKHFGTERWQAKAEIVRNRPTTTSAQVTFCLDDKGVAKLVAKQREERKAAD